MGVEILVPWRAFHRACCAISTNEGKPLPINDKILFRTYNMLEVNNGANADFLVRFNTEEDAMLFLLKWS